MHPSGRLIEGIDAKNLLADWGYDADAIIDLALSLGMEVVIPPPKRNRKVQRDYDKELYKLRHIVENASSFLAAVYIRCIAIWLKSFDDTTQVLKFTFF